MGAGPGLASNLGCLRNDAGYNANWCGVGISFHGCLVAGWRCNQGRQRQRQLIICQYYFGLVKYKSARLNVGGFFLSRCPKTSSYCKRKTDWAGSGMSIFACSKAIFTASNPASVALATLVLLVSIQK